MSVSKRMINVHRWSPTAPSGSVKGTLTVLGDPRGSVRGITSGTLSGTRSATGAKTGTGNAVPSLPLKGTLGHFLL